MAKLTAAASDLLSLQPHLLPPVPQPPPPALQEQLLPSVQQPPPQHSLLPTMVKPGVSWVLVLT